MARHARWIRRPSDPKSAWGWVIWHEFHPAAAQRRNLIWMIPAVMFLTALCVPLDSPVPFVLGLLGFMSIAAYARPGAREHASLPTLGEHDAFPVTLDLRNHRGRTIGRERGWIAFVDGWLVYEGPRTSFSLDAASTKKLWSSGWQFRLELPGRNRVRFTLLTDRLQTDLPANRQTLGRFRDALARWRQAEAPFGEPLLPPVEIHPIVWADWLRGSMMFGILCFVLMLGGMITAGNPMAIGGAFGLAISLILYWRESKKTRARLRALDPRSLE